MKDEKLEAAGLTEIEKSAIGEICDLITASLAKTFSESIDSDVSLEPSQVDVMAFEKIGSLIDTPVLLMHFNCAAALEGQFFFAVYGDGLPEVFDLAIPDNVKETEADDDKILEGLKVIVNQSFSKAFENLAESMGQEIDCSVVDAIVLQDESGFESIGFLYPEGELLNVSTGLVLPSSIVSISYLLPLSVSKQMIELLLKEQQITGPAEGEVAGMAEVIDLEASQQTQFKGQAEEKLKGEEVPKVVDMQPAKFNVLSEEPATVDGNNISLLLDVALEASIELGKTQMTIEEILKLTRGSVIELDKLASEPVEFLVNGKVIARGEVVVIDDNFGIRITEILSPRARLESI